MDTAKIKSISINDRVISITQQSAKLRNSLDSQRAPEVIDGLKTLENSSNASVSSSFHLNYNTVI